MTRAMTVSAAAPSLASAPAPIGLLALLMAMLILSPAGAARAQVSPTPNLCNTVAQDIASRYVVQLVTGAPDSAPEGLVGRFATAVQLYTNLQCPVGPLAAMLECLQVAAIETGGDMRSMIDRRRTCETAYRNSITGAD